MSFPPVPPDVKSVTHFLKVADEYEQRDLTITYWARMYACQVIMKIVPGTKPPDVSNLLIALLDWLENTKRNNPTVDGLSNETVAQAIFEQYAIQLFAYADSQDRMQNFNKNTVKAFYTCAILLDIIEQFGEPTDDLKGKRKYAKWKAAYIHNCLKVGDIPLSGGPDEQQPNIMEDIDKNEGEDEDPGNVENPPPESSVSGGDSPPAVVMPSPSPPPRPSATVVVAPSPAAPADADWDPEQIQLAQKYCKFATSALNYDDVKSAVENLTQALEILQRLGG